MNNLEKLGKLYQFFANCDWNHNSNKGLFEAADNGFAVTIEFDVFNSNHLKIKEGFVFKHFDKDGDIVIKISHDAESGELYAFTWDFELLDEMLTVIFRDFILTDMETIEMDYVKLSNNA